MMSCDGRGGGNSQIDYPISIESSTTIEKVDFMGNAMR